MRFLLTVGVVGLLLAQACGEVDSSPSDSVSSPDPQASVTTSATPKATPTLKSSPTPGVTLADSALPTPTPTSEPAPTVLLPSNSTALFGRVYGGATSDKLRTTDKSGQIHDIRLESSSYALVMVPILPSLGEPIVFDTYTSPSYAKSVKSPSTFDDQLFVVRRWDSGSTDVTEFDVETLEPFLSEAADNFLNAVIGDSAYHYSYPNYDNFYGWRGQLQFVREPLDGSDPIRTTLGNVQSYLNHPYLPFSLISANEKLYGLKEPSSSDPSIIIL